MRIATWNVNSLRSRIDRVVGVLDRHDLDVLLVQETKCRDDQFPGQPLEEAGYTYAHVGHNQWNGVAIISRVGLEDVEVGFPGMPDFGDPAVAEARALGATCGGVRLWSLYVPNGRDLENAHYRYKLAWLEQLRAQTAATLAADPTTPLILGGDWNIAPTDEDVWDPEFFVGKTHVSAPERAAFTGLLDAGLHDLTREYTPGPGTFTYWDYTQLRFPKRQGMRIDFLLGNDAARQLVSGASIDREERKGKGASDHAPVLLDLDERG